MYRGEARHRRLPLSPCELSLQHTLGPHHRLCTRAAPNGAQRTVHGCAVQRHGSAELTSPSSGYASKSTEKHRCADARSWDTFITVALYHNPSLKRAHTPSPAPTLSGTRVVAASGGRSELSGNSTPWENLQRSKVHAPVRDAWHGFCDGEQARTVGVRAPSWCGHSSTELHTSATERGRAHVTNTSCPGQQRWITAGSTTTVPAAMRGAAQAWPTAQRPDAGATGSPPKAWIAESLDQQHGRCQRERA